MSPLNEKFERLGRNLPCLSRLNFAQVLALRLLIALLCLLIADPTLADTKFFPERKVHCLECHGENGKSATTKTPSLGGIAEYYALLQLVEFRDGNRSSEIMRNMVEDMTDDDLRAAAAFVGEQPRPPVPSFPGNPKKMLRGASLIAQHRCNQCHGKKYLGGHQMPPLRHQREDYLLKALRDYKAEHRLGDRAAMVEVVTPIADEDLTVLAYYLAYVRD